MEGNGDSRTLFHVSTECFHIPRQSELEVTTNHSLLCNQATDSRSINTHRGSHRIDTH